MHVSLEELQARLLEENLKIMFTQAYEQGLQDARETYALPFHLRKRDIANLFQVGMPTVDKIIRMEGFPKSKVISARYPRDKVLKWAENNVELVNYQKVVV